jgi:Ca2+-binding EF-hand superfamily protein
MNPERPPKKTETLEVRVPHATKQAFMARCRDEGRSASDVIREFIDGYLARPSIQPERRKIMSNLFQPSLMGAAFAAVAVALLGPTAGRAGPDLRQTFRAIDRNADQNISLAEFLEHQKHNIVVSRVALAGAHAPSHAKPFALPRPPHGTPMEADGERPSPEFVRARFAELDTGRDGAVSFTEFEAHHQAMTQTSFRTVDRNGDGRVDRSEWLAAPWPVDVSSPDKGPPQFEDYDADRDGFLSAEELHG